MPDQDKKVTLVNTLIEGGRNENSASQFDIIVLSQDKGVNDAGRVIAIQNSGGISGYSHDLVSYAYVVKGSDTTLTISGNYGLNTATGERPQEYDILYWNRTSEQMSYVDAAYNAPSSVTVNTLLNAYHFAYNNDYQSNVAGAIKLTGDNKLVLTSQAGSATSNYYWAANGFNEHGNKIQKTDDAITIVAHNYGIYSPWAYNGTTGEKFVYGIYTSGPAAPGSTTANYAIHSTGSKLTVTSDLAGDIDVSVAALHTGYYVKNSEAGKPPVAQSDSSDNIVDAAGVKAENLVLASNFRANILAQNNSDTFLYGLLTSQDPINEHEKNRIYEWKVVTETTGGQNSSSEKKAVQDTSRYVVVEGTAIAGFASPVADNNKINSYGMISDGSITLENGVWSGEIVAETSDITISAKYKDVASVDQEGMAASAVGNEVGAYGIKAKTITIAKLGILQKDYDGVNPAELYASSITAIANNVSVSARSIGKLDKEKGRGATSANASVAIEAVAIDGTTIKIGEMTSDFSLYAESGDHYAEAVNESSHNDNSGSLSASAAVFGIRGSTVEFGIFDGNITARGGSFDYEALNWIGKPSAGCVATGIGADTLTVTRKFAGVIEASSFGIYVDKNFTVAGAISTEITTGIGITVIGNLTADAFAGTINASGGLSVNGAIASNASNQYDAFDVTGTISVRDFGITSLSPLNLRISGEITANGNAVNAESYYDGKEKTWKFTPGVKHTDHVELAAGATVTGNINLGQLLNTFVINSSATFTGVVIAQGGSVNTTFILDEEARKDGQAAYTVTQYDAGDTLLKGSQLININLSYASNGTYDLIQYYYHSFTDDTGVTHNSLWDFWQNNKCQIVYLDKVYNDISFDTKVGDTYSGSVTVADANGKEATFTVTYDTSEDILSVTVAGLSGDFEYVPKQLDVTATAATYVAVEKTEGVFTLDWSELDSYLKANIESTLAGEDTYGLEKVTNYKVRYKFVDAEGNDVEILNESGSQLWTELKFYEVNGTKLTVENAPEGAENVVWEIVPVDDTVSVVESKEAKAALSTAIADGGLELSWQDLAAEDVGLVDFDSIDLVEIVYSLYDTNGFIIGSKNQSMFITIDDFNKGSYIVEADEGTRIRWTLKFHDVVNAEDNTGEFNFNESTVVNSYTQQYDAEKAKLTIDWNELNESLTAEDGLKDFNFANGILNYEIEYQIYDENGRPVGKTIVVTLDAANTKYTFSGIEEGTSLKWRIRIVGNETGGLVSKWSEWNTIDVETLPSEGFDLNEFESSVRSVYSTVADNAVPNSIAELQWDKVVSAEAIRCYEIEYFRRPDQVSLEDAKAAGFSSVQEYISSDEFFNSADQVYRKVVSGTSVVLSDLTNNGFFYWRLRAIDETAELDKVLSGKDTAGSSDWVAGATFCVHENGETTVPDLQKNKQLGSYVEVGMPATYDGNADITGYLCWNSAIEQDSGMRHYVVEFRDQAGNLVATKTKQAVDAQSRCIGSWEVGEGILLDDEYSATVSVNGSDVNLEISAKLVEYQEDVELGDGTVQTQTKYKTVLHFTTDVDLTGKTITFSNGTDSWNVAAYDEKNNPDGFAFQKFDYALELDDIDKDFDPSKKYSYTITATDNFSNSGVTSIVTGQITVDVKGPIFVDGGSHDNFVVDDQPEDPASETLLNGYICWNGAIEGEYAIRRYVVTLLDENGNTMVDRNGKECTAVVDQTGDPTTVLVPSRCLATYSEDVIPENTYNVFDSQGVALESIVRPVKTVNEEGESEIKYELVITATRDLTGETIRINGKDVVMAAENCKFFDFSIDLGQWNLDDPNYTYNIYAEDILGNKSQVVLENNFVIDEQAPVFTDTLSEAVKYSRLNIAGDLSEASTYSVRLGWQSASDDYGVRQYIIKLDDGNGNVIEKTISSTEAADDYAMVMFRSKNLVLGEEYTVYKINDNGTTEEVAKVYACINSGYSVDFDQNGITGVDTNGVEFLAWSLDGALTGNEKFQIRKGDELIADKIGGALVYEDGKYQYVNYGNSIEIEGLTSCQYSYTITAEDFFGAKSQVAVSGGFIYDNKAPGFTSTKTETSGFTFVRPVWDPEKEDNLTPAVSYSTYIGWHNAEDKANGGQNTSGLRMYRLEISFDDGKTWEEPINIGLDDILLTDRSFCKWVPEAEEALDAEAQYRICVGEGGKQQEFAAVVTRRDGSNELCLSWVYDGDLGASEYKTISIQKNINGSWVEVSTSAINEQSYTYYECSWELANMASEKFTYRIVAVDNFDNSTYISKNITVDNGIPGFAVNSVQVEVNDPGAVAPHKLTPQFFWQPAQDQAGDVGVRYYVVKYRLKGSDTAWAESGPIEHRPGTTEYMWAPNVKLDWDVYEYRIYAYDFFGNETFTEGSFGTPDVDGPKVTFDDDAFASTVTFKYDNAKEWRPRLGNDGRPVLDSNGQPIMDEVIVTTQQQRLDSNGNPMFDSNNMPIMDEVPVRGHLAEATVTLKWDGEFEDDNGIRFKVTVSDSMDFSPEGKTYDFWTTEKSLVFDKDTPGRNVGLFEGMETVYWRVQVYDDYYNAGDKLGDVQEFEFVNDKSEPLTATTDFSAPEITGINYKWLTTDDQRANTAQIQWTHAEQPLGVYYYEITLTNKANSKLVYTANTLDSSVNGASTDLSDLVSYSKSSNRFVLSDLLELIRSTDSTKTDIIDGKYNLVVTAYDTNGRAKSSKAVEFVLDDTRPDRINRSTLEKFVVADNIGHENYSQPVVRWDAVEDRTSGVDHYEISYRIQGSNSKFETVKLDANTCEFIFPSVALGVSYEFYIIAIDKSGNRSYDWGNEEYEVITAEAVDRYRDSLKVMEGLSAEIWAGDRLVIEDSVGMGDSADMFKIQTDKSTAIALTTERLGNLLGTNDDVTIQIYKIVNGNYTGAKVWKSYSVKSTGQVFADLLLDANSTYVFKVVSQAPKKSVADYKFVIDRKDLGGIGNDNSDDTFELAVAEHKVFDIKSELNDESSFSDWVGYGDKSDWKVLSIINSGEFNFALEGVAMGVTLTVYEKLANGKMKKLGSVTASQKNLDGNILRNIVLDKAGKYYLEVKANNAKAYGSDYKVTVECVDSYPAPTVEDDLKAVFSDPDNVPKLAINSKIESDSTGDDLWVGIGDTVDYYMLDGKVAKDTPYSLKLDNTNGKEVKVAVGYFNADGKFVVIASKTGAAGSTAVNMLCKFSYDQLNKSKGKLYVQVSSNGTNANSRYIVEFNEYNSSVITDLDNSDDSAAITAKTLTAGVTEAGWVGFSDAVDYRKLTVADNGLYEIKLDGAENNLTITVVQKIENNGKISYRTVKSVKAAANNSSVTTGAMLLDADETYFVSITATGAKKGGDSTYNLEMVEVAAAEQLEGKTTFAMADDINNVANAVSYVYDAAEQGGAYKFTLNNTDATGSVKLTVYELLTTGKKRTVKTITVKAGAEGNTGYLYFDDTAAKNGTGIYQVEVVGSSSKVTGAVGVTGSGYSFDKYLAVADDVNNSYGTTNWVGMGDETDSYDYKVTTEGIKEFKLSGFDGNSIKLKIVDSVTGKVLKSFTPAKGSSEATFAYDFKAVGDYKIVVEANGKGKFSEYNLTFVDRTDDAKVQNNASDELDAAKLSVGNPINNGWVGLGDAKDFYAVEVSEAGNYELDIDNLDNNVKVTLYEATAWNYDGTITIQKGKVIKSITAAEANNGGILNGIWLDKTVAGANEYYVVVEAANSKGTGNTTYSIDMKQVSEFTAPIEGGIVSNGNAVSYEFEAIAGATNITLSLNDGSLDETAVLTLYQVNKATGKYTKVTSVTANSKSLSVNTGDLCLDYGATYVVEVASPKAAAGKNVGFDLSIDSWKFADFAGDTANDVMSKEDATKLTLGEKTGLNAVWTNGDAVDYYYVNVAADGSYSIDLSDINGKTIKVSLISVTAKGSKVLQSVTGKAGADSLVLSRMLTAGEYYVKVESVGKNTASQYDLTMTCNNARDNGVFSNADDTWKLVAGNTAAVSCDTDHTISDWVGFGDTTDVFKIKLDENGATDNHQIALVAENDTTKTALQNKTIALKLMDAAGKTVSLVYDPKTGYYVSKSILMAGVDYYLQVTNNSPKSSNVDYKINIVEYNMFDKSDDSWELVAGNVTAKSYDTSKIISDWVGYDDAADVFKVKLNEKRKITFAAENQDTEAAISNGDITLSLVDETGNTVELVLENNHYTSSAELNANSNYYLQVESNDQSSNVNYSLNIVEAEMFSNADDDWQEVKAAEDWISYNISDGSNTVTDWVGFGDSRDVFKVTLEENNVQPDQRLAFVAENDETMSAFKDNAIKLSLVDEDGNTIDLAFDSDNNRFICDTETMLTAGDYYLTVSTDDQSKYSNIDYSFKIVEVNIG